jgi:hypothetical protein
MSTRWLRPHNQFQGLGSAAAPMITDTGMRGFLKWARREYPAKVYQAIAGRIQQQIPSAFSGYMLGGWRNLARLNGFADTSPTIDTADAANSTPNAPSWSDQISQIIGTATGAYLNITQQQQQQQILNAQLQAAQNGRAPLPISLGSNGVTFTSAGQLTATEILLGIGALFLLRKVMK